MSNENELWDLSDEELEAAYKEALAEEDSPETDLESSEEKEEDFSEDETLDEKETSKETDEDEPEEESESEEDSSEENADEADKEDESENESDNPEEESEENEDDSSEEATDEKDEEQPVESYKFRADGKDYEFSSEEIVDQFPKIFGQAMNYTKKMQAIKPWRKTIDAIEHAKLNHDDVSLMIDVLKGDKNAITEVLRRTGTDTLDIDMDEESKYVAKDYGRDEKSLAIKDIVEDISKDTEYATTKSILEKEWDETSWGVISDKPDMIRLLHADVKSGMYGKLQPVAEKLKVFDGAKRSDIEYYEEAAKEYFNKTAKLEAYNKQKLFRESEQESDKAKKAKLEEVKATSKKRTAVKEASAKRKAAAPSKAAATKRGIVDYLDGSDEDYDEWYKNLQNS